MPATRNNVYVNQTPPGGYPAAAMERSLNTQLAQAYAAGDPRLAVKSYDRPGMSRGASQWNQAGIDSARRLVEGVSNAYGQHLQNLAYNADVGLQGHAGREQFSQALGGLQTQNDYAQQMSDLQRQQSVLGLYSGLLGGLLR